jgi:AraC-like DNA-binding protein
MPWDLDFFSLVVLFGACQGLILSCILFLSKKENSPGKNYLGFFILILAYNGFETFNWSSGVGDYSLIFDFLGFVLIFGLGPSLYLYVYALTHPNVKYPKPVFRHFFPVLLQLLFKASLFTYYVLWMNNVEIFNLSPSDIDNWHANISEPTSVVAFWIYLLLSFQLFKIYRNENISNRAAISAHEKRPVRQSLTLFLSAILIFALTWTLTVFAPQWITFGNNQYYFIEIFLVMLVYWVAFSGFRRTKIIYVELQKPVQIITRSYSLTEMQRIEQLLQTAMEIDKLYLDAELSVSKLASHLDINPKILSSVLNQYPRKGFAEFVNEYRVAEVKIQLLDPTKKHLTIAGIALDSGFNSQATFGRAFKSITGMSPKRFLSLRTRKYA